MKINFTESHMTRLKELATKALFEGWVIQGKFNQAYSIEELVRVTTIDSLNNLKSDLSNKIKNLEDKDEWIEKDSEKIILMREKKELLNLLVGYKRYNLEIELMVKEKKQLLAKREELLEMNKTPEDKIKEINKRLEELEDDFK